MRPKIKLIWAGPLFFIRSRQARRIAKKIIKYDDEERYPQQWRNDYVLKKAKKLLKFLKVNVVVQGWNNIPKSTSLIAANHTSAIDPAVLLVALENPSKTTNDHNIMPVFLAKKELKSNQRFNGYMDIINTFYIDRKKPREALEIFDKIINHAKTEKKHIVIFPEGTRSNDGKLQEFKSGGFRIAKKAFVSIIPTTINNTLVATNLNRNYKLEVEIIFHPPIKPLQVISMQHIDIAKKVKTIISQKLITQTGKRSAKERKIT